MNTMVGAGISAICVIANSIAFGYYIETLIEKGTETTQTEKYLLAVTSIIEVIVTAAFLHYITR